MAASLNPYISKFDAGFDAEKSSQYRMTIQFSLGGFSYALLDTKSQTLIALECFQSDTLTDSAELFHATERALEHKNLNSKDFESVVCLIDERTNTLVPTLLFDEKEAADHLDFAFHLSSEQSILSETLEMEDCVNVYATSKSLLSKIRTKWPTARVRHSSTVFIDSSLRYAPEGNAAFVQVKNRNFDMAIVKDGRLSFYNNFKFNTKDDFAYFLLFAIEQNGFSGLELPVCLSGLILPASEIVELSKRYIQHLSFVEDRHKFQVSDALGDVPFQYYYLLYQALR